MSLTTTFRMFCGLWMGPVPEQYFHVGQISVVSRENHRRLEPPGAIDNRHRIVVFAALSTSGETWEVLSPELRTRIADGTNSNPPKRRVGFAAPSILNMPRLLALCSRLVTRREWLRAIQIANSTCLIGRIAAAEKTRESAQCAAICCLEPLIRRRREIPGTRSLNPDVRHRHSRRLSLFVKLTFRKSSPISSGSPAIPRKRTVLSLVIVKLGKSANAKYTVSCDPFNPIAAIQLGDRGIGIRQG